MWWILIDVIAVAVVVYFVWTSAKKGFAKAILDLAAFFAAYFLAASLSGVVAGWAYETLAGDKLVAGIEADLNNASNATLTEVLPDYIVSGAQSLGIYDDIIASQSDSAHETAVLLGENIAKPVITTLVRLVSASVIFIVLMFVLRIIVRAINKIFKLPIVKGVNAFLGGLLGLAKGGIVLLVGCFIISLLMMFSQGSFLIFTPENIDKTILFKLIYNLNPFIK